MKYVNGETYEGEFRAGGREGVGTYRSDSGEVLLEGKWLRDQYVSPF